ncbi:MAG: 3-phosphoshikimate 1-carboxyvinyltransferase, partial [Candidatus Jacksonbacteria bacterium]
IEIIGELTSKPYVDMTIDVMWQFGVKVVNQDYKIFKVKAGQKYQPRDYQIEPDASGASYFMAGAALTGRCVRFPGLSIMSKQGDVGFARVLAKCQMSNVNPASLQGQKYKVKGKSLEDCLEFYGTGELKGISVDMNSMPDMVPTLAVLAMFAKGKTVIKNVANLRIKECDRLHALATEIRKFGIKIKELPDGLKIFGNPKLLITNYELRITIKTYNDHRMAMAFAVAKLVMPDIIIENQDCTVKSFPEFWKEWHKICIPSL